MSEEKVIVYEPGQQEKVKQMLGRIRSEFQEDLLFNLLVERGLEDEALNDSIGTLEVGKTYSTSDLAELLELKSDSNIRNILRPLKKYIKPDESTGSYRLDYKACFRIQMIILLKDEYKLPALAKMLGGGSSIDQNSNSLADTKVQELKIQLQYQNQQIDTMSKILQRMYETNLFKIEGIGDQAKVTINEQYISEMINKTTAPLLKDASYQEEVKNLVLNQAKLIENMEMDQKNKEKETEQLKQELSNLTKKVEELSSQKSKKGLFSRLFGG